MGKRKERDDSVQRVDVLTADTYTQVRAFEKKERESAKE
jgi:hypothetical protein